MYRVSTKSLDNLKNLLILQLTLKMFEMFKQYQLNGQVFIQSINKFLYEPYL